MSWLPLLTGGGRHIHPRDQVRLGRQRRLLVVPTSRGRKTRRPRALVVPLIFLSLSGCHYVAVTVGINHEVHIFSLRYRQEAFLS